MDKKAQVEQLTTYMANFVSYIGKKSGSCQRAEPSKLSGYRSIAVLGKMWNKLSTDRRTGGSFERSRCKGNF